MTENRVERYFEIKNFRNIGLSKPQKLVLNTSLNKNQLGNVVYLVGPNNSGKSNVLDALELFSTNQISKKDIPDFDDKDPIPELSFVTYENEITIKQTKTLKLQNKFSGFSMRNSEQHVTNHYEPSKEASDFALNVIRFLTQNGHGNLNGYGGVFNAAISSGKYTHNPKVFQDIDKAVVNTWGATLYNRFAANDTTKINQWIQELTIDEGSEIEQKYFDQYDYKLIPNIVRFKSTDIKQSMFSVNANEIKQSPFLSALFASIDYNIDELVNSYAKYNERKTRGTLTNTEQKINHMLESVTTRFNKLYYLENKKYRFEIILDPNLVSFQIFLEDITLNFDSQSTGFKWFFNFYFTLVSHKNLETGDIIIMDEPATNLHVKGIEELRDFIKDYARKNKLVFIISTHSPFFIDVDYLENVRVINRTDNESIINSKFHMLEKNDIDSLGPIKQALTIGRHILINPIRKTIFVEGLTDYAYLTAFKLHFKYDDIVFLPISGLNDDDKEHAIKTDKDLFEVMLKIEKSPTLLVDSDKPGEIVYKRAKEKYAGRIDVIRLVDADPSFIKIENLFQTDEIGSKTFSDAVTFKHYVVMNKINAKTKENFKKLLDYVRG